MNWEDILKIKDTAGNNLIVRDVDNFIERLRAAVRVAASQYFGEISQAKREGEPRVSNINIRQNYISDEILRIRISYRHRESKEREFFEIILREDETGDYYFLRISGPGVNLTDNSIVSSETKLITIIVEAVERNIQFNIPESKDLRDTSGEDRQTSEQTIRDVEEANPGYLYINQKMYKITDLEEQADKEGITYEQLLRRLGRITKAFGQQQTPKPSLGSKAKRKKKPLPTAPDKYIIYMTEKYNSRMYRGIWIPMWRDNPQKFDSRQEALDWLTRMMIERGNPRGWTVEGNTYSGHAIVYDGIYEMIMAPSYYYYIAEENEELPDPNNHNIRVDNTTRDRVLDRLEGKKYDTERY